MMKIAVYPGSFDPITYGHLDIIERASQIFDKVIVLIAVNPNKTSRFSIQDRVDMIKEEVDPNKIEVDFFDGLTADYAIKHNCKHLIRGLRAVTDFDYEFQLAKGNEYVNKDLDTVFLMSKNDMTFINSSIVMELYKGGVDVGQLVPPSVIKRLKK